MKRKSLSIILIIILLIAFASCRTSKTPPSGPPIVNTEQDKNILLRFVVMADSRGSDAGINEKAVAKTLENIKKLSPQPLFAIMPGDLVDGSKKGTEVEAQLQHFKDTVTKYYPINFFYPGFGNHEAEAVENGEEAFEEVFSEFKAEFLEGFHKTVYYFDKNDTRFYMLNSNHAGSEHSITGTQLEWIKANSNSGKKHNLYFFHEPAFPTGSHVGSSLDVNKLHRDTFWKVVDDSENPLTFCGHEHNYTRRHINSAFNETIGGQDFNFNKVVYQITTGTFGAPVYRGYTDKKKVDVPPVPEYHFTVVDINKYDVRVTVYNLDGKLIDHFEQTS